MSISDSMYGVYKNFKQHIDGVVSKLGIMKNDSRYEDLKVRFDAIDFSHTNVAELSKEEIITDLNNVISSHILDDLWKLTDERLLLDQRTNKTGHQSKEFSNCKMLQYKISVLKLDAKAILVGSKEEVGDINKILYNAVFDKQQVVIDYLLRVGADPFYIDQNGESAFCVALSRDAEEIAKDFVRHKFLASSDLLELSDNIRHLLHEKSADGEFAASVATGLLARDNALLQCLEIKPSDDAVVNRCFYHAKNCYEHLTGECYEYNPEGV